MPKKLYFSILLFVLLSAFYQRSTFAHVVVKPLDVTAGDYLNFSVDMPNERDVPTIALRLVIPEGVKVTEVKYKLGWSSKIIRKDYMADGPITEIIWSGGTIPGKERAIFHFDAEVPATETTLKWIAYQTYSNGEVVAWDKEPLLGGTGSLVKADAEANESEHVGGEAEITPYSETKVAPMVTQSSVSVKVIDTKIAMLTRYKTVFLFGATIVFVAFLLVGYLSAHKKNS